jgi:hypothetical protein
VTDGARRCPATPADPVPSGAVATRRLNRDQRNLLLFAGGMLLASFLLVALLLVWSSASNQDGSATNDGPVEFGSAAAIAQAIQTTGPRCYPDLAGGTKPVCLDLLDGHLVALRALVPGTTDCAVSVDRTTLALVDCRGGAVDGHVLDQFAVSVAAGPHDTLSVDLRQLLAPRASTATAGSAGAGPPATSRP